MNEYDSALKDLSNHAGGLTGNEEEKLRDQSLLLQLAMADQRKIRPDFALFDDVVRCIAVLNIHINGPDPNTRSPGPRLRPIPDAAVYWIACILEDCLHWHRKWSADQQLSSDELEILLRGTHKIAHAWAQFLAGDITDLLESFEG